MKYLFLLLLSVCCGLVTLSAQPPIVTSELWSHPATRGYYPFFIALSPNGQYAAYTSEYGKYCHLYDIEHGKRVRTYTRPFGSFGGLEFGPVQFTPNSQYMMYGIGANRRSTYDLVSCQTGDIHRTFTPNNTDVEMLSFSPDGARAAFGGDSILYEWDWEANTIMHTFAIPHGALLGDYSPDGKYLAVIDYDGNGSVIRMLDGSIMCSFYYKSKTYGDNLNISFSAIGQELIILGNSGSYSFTYWDPVSGAFLRGVKNLNGFYSGAIAANRKIAVTNTYNNTIWDAETGTELKTIPLYNDLPIRYPPRNASALELNADGTILLAFTGYASSAAEIELYDTQKGELSNTITGTQTEYKPYRKHFSLDDTKLIGVGSAKFKVWDITTGNTLYRYDSGPFSGYFSSVAHSTVSGSIAVSYKDTVFIYRDITEKPTTIGVSGKTIYHLEYSNNGEYIAFGYHTTGAILDEDYHSGIGLIDTKTNTIAMMKELQEISPIKWLPNIVTGISFNASDDQLVVLADDLYAVISVPKFKLIQFLSPGHHVGSVRFAPDGTLLEVGENGWIRYKISSTATETTDEFLIPPPTNSPYSNGFPNPYAISHDTRFCAIGYKGGNQADGTDSVLVVWDIMNKKEVARFRSGIEYGYLAFTPNNKILISVGLDGTICAWDIELATTEVEEVHSLITESRMTISPNPASDEFTVHCLGAGILTVHDVLGRVLVKKDHSLDTESIISTQDFTPGVYFVEYSENSSKRSVVKIVVYK